MLRLLPAAMALVLVSGCDDRATSDVAIDEGGVLEVIVGDGGGSVQVVETDFLLEVGVCASRCEYEFDSTPVDLELTALPDEGFQFISWSNDCSGTELNTTLTVDTGQAPACVAAFGGESECAAMFDVVLSVEPTGEARTFDFEGTTYPAIEIPGGTVQATVTSATDPLTPVGTREWDGAVQDLAMPQYEQVITNTQTVTLFGNTPHAVAARITDDCGTVAEAVLVICAGPNPECAVP